MFNSENIFPKQLTMVLKGLLAIIIVGSHLHYVTDISIWHIFNKIAPPVVAMFFFISGYGLMSSLKKSSGINYLKTFFSKRLLTVVKPFVIVTILYLLVKWIFFGDVPNNILYDLYEKGYTPLPNSWFIFSLIYFYLSFYFSFKYISNRNIAIVFVSFLSVLFLLWCIFKGYDRAWWVCALSFPMGIICSQYKWISIINNWYVIILMSIVVIFIDYIHIGYILPLAYVFIPFIVLGLCNLTKFSRFTQYLYSIDSPNMFVLILRSVLDFFSNISYELYLVHGAFIYMLSTNKTIHSSDYIFSFWIFTLSTLSAFVLHKLLNISFHSSKKQ